MALRTAHTLLGTFVRAGVLCLASNARTCVAHSLPATPDSVVFSPVNLASNTVGAFLESWDSTTLSFTKSANTALSIYLRAAVDHSVIS